jgi:carbon-monoxide dehydrogenase large subunit
MAAASRSPVQRRVEDARLLAGRGHYVNNLTLPGMFHMKLARSPYASATVKGIDTSAARSAPGVVEVLTATDLSDVLRPFPTTMNAVQAATPAHLPLALDRVTYVGEPIAVVLATDAAAAEDALDLVAVDYEPGVAVVDPEQAVAPGGRLVHPDLRSNVAYKMAIGEPGEAMAAADVVVRRRLVNQRVIPSPMETRGVVADYSPFDDALVLHTSTQGPHIIRTQLADMLGMNEGKIRVVAGDVGGAFGAKLNVYAEDVLAAVLSRRTGRPVKWIETRSESTVATTHGRDLIATVDIAASRDGKLAALHISVLSDLGAHFGVMPSLGGLLTCMMMSGPYRLPQITFDVTGVFTNKTPVDPYRGYYRSEATYFLERMIDLLAAELDMDALELRRRNMLTPAELPYVTATGEQYDVGDYPALLDRALALADYDRLRARQASLRRQGRYLGIGLSTYVWRASFPSMNSLAPTIDFLPGGWEAATVRVERTGSVTVRTGASPHGQGLGNALAAVAADVLGVDVAEVTVVTGDTESTPYGIGSAGSRSMVVAGSAVRVAADRVKDKAVRLAAHLLEAAPEDIEWAGSRLHVRGVPDRGYTLADLGRLAAQAPRPPGTDPNLEVEGYFDPEQFTYPAGAHVSVVEVDRDTGRVDVLQHVAVDDCGRVIMGMIVDGQVHGGTVQGIGQALFEEAVFDRDGNLLTNSFVSYELPSAAEVPTFVTDRIETLTARNPLGVKGAGESGTVGAPPAVVNAVVDALAPLGVRHIEMPLTPQRVWEAIRQATGM